MEIFKLTIYSASALFATASIAQEAESYARFQLLDTVTKHKDSAERLTQTEYRFELEYHALLLEARQKNTGMESVGSLTTLSPGVQYFHELSNNWAVWPSFTLEVGFESQVNSESVTYRPQIIGLRSLSRELHFIVGAGSRYHSVDPRYYPVIGFAWQPESESRWSGLLAFPQSSVNVRFSEKLGFQAGFGWDLLYYRLRNDSPVGTYLRTQAFVPQLGVEYQLGSDARLIGGLHYAFDREFRFYDSHKQLIDQRHVSSEWAVRLGIEFQL